VFIATMSYGSVVAAVFAPMVIISLGIAILARQARRPGH